MTFEKNSGRQQLRQGIVAAVRTLVALLRLPAPRAEEAEELKMGCTLKRRCFFAATGAAATLWSLPTFARAAPSIGRRHRIDALGSLGGFVPGVGDDGPMTPEQVQDIARSGLTAMHVTVGASGNGEDLLERTLRRLANQERELARRPDMLLKVRNAADLDLARRQGRLGIIYGFQDTAMIGTDISLLGVFHHLGVRIVQLTYNRRNLVGDGCLETANGGLSSFGREVMTELERLQILVDLSHAGQRVMAEAISTATKPLAITHTGCRALVDLPRNTTDLELRALADKGGVVGIYMMPFLRAAGQPTSADLVRHLEHAINICGEDHVGIGSDGTLSPAPVGAEYIEMHRNFVAERRRRGTAAPGESESILNILPDLNRADRFSILDALLRKRGHAAARVDKILGGNFARLFRDVWA